MAVTIEEVEVEVTGSQAQPAGTPPAAKKDSVDLLAALERVRERQARLRAD